MMLALALPSGVAALAAGTVLALGAAMLVLAPLTRETPEPPTPRPADADRAAPSTGAVDALREIEFDRATGKLSDDDYAALRASYTNAALAELRAKDAATAVVADDDAVESAIRRFRGAGAGAACVDCGPRPEVDAVFCSSCGRYLAGACARCSAACDRPGQRFCSDCGHDLAAAAAA